MLAGKLVSSGAISALAMLSGMSATAQAQTATSGFNVTIRLKTFHDTVTADQRCTHSGASRGNTLRIHCPKAVDVQAIARASATKSGQIQRMNSDRAVVGKDSRFSADDKLISFAEPVELTISW